MGSFYKKMTNAFSNRIYLKIIWRVSTSRIEYLRHTESFAKIDSVSFFMCFGHFDSLFRLTLMPLKIQNIFLALMYLKALIILILEWAHFPLHFKQLSRYDLSKLERFDEFLAFYIGKSQKFGHQNSLSFLFLSHLLHGLTWNLVSTILDIQSIYTGYRFFIFWFFGIQWRFKGQIFALFRSWLKFDTIWSIKTVWKQSNCFFQCFMIIRPVLKYLLCDISYFYISSIFDLF